MGSGGRVVERSGGGVRVASPLRSRWERSNGRADRLKAVPSRVRFPDCASRGGCWRPPVGLAPPQRQRVSLAPIGTAAVRMPLPRRERCRSREQRATAWPPPAGRNPTLSPHGGQTMGVPVSHLVGTAPGRGHCPSVCPLGIPTPAEAPDRPAWRQVCPFRRDCWPSCARTSPCPERSSGRSTRSRAPGAQPAHRRRRRPPGQARPCAAGVRGARGRAQGVHHVGHDRPGGPGDPARTTGELGQAVDPGGTGCAFCWTRRS